MMKKVILVFLFIFMSSWAVAQERDLVPALVIHVIGPNQENYLQIYYMPDWPTCIKAVESSKAQYAGETPAGAVIVHCALIER